MFKGLSNFTSILKQAQQLGGQMQELNDQLKTKRTTGTAGGGMVEVEINGVLEVLKCQIDEQLVQQGDRELIEDLTVAAVNQAVQKAKQMHAESLRELTGGLQLPGLEEALAKITSTESTESTESDEKTT